MKGIDPKLLEKINAAIHQTLMTMVRSVVSIGATPQTVISMIRERLDMIETMVKETERGTSTDGVVRGDGGAGEAAEAPLVAEAQADQQPADVRRVRGGFPTHGPTTDEEPAEGNPRRPWPRSDNQAAYGTGPGLDPNEPF